MKNIVTLGQINDALKIASVTAAQLAEMGFAALENKPICEALPPEESRRLRNAKLYPVESIAQIRVALAKRLAAPACSLLQIQEPVPALTAPRLDDAWKVRMLDGQPLVRDKDGIGYHPALPDFDEGVKCADFFSALGIELKCGMAENEMDSDAYEAMTENGLTEDGDNYNAWTPARPEGEGWNLVAVFDTEDGPACWWMRDKPAVPFHERVENYRTRVDNAAVEVLAMNMKAKLAVQRDKGYRGWNNDCTQQHLSDLLRQCVDKGDPVDVANFCAFLLARGETIAQLAAPVAAGEREAFEAWARSYGSWEVKRDDDQALGTTGYTDLTLTVAWHAIQGRAALAAKPAAGFDAGNTGNKTPVPKWIDDPHDIEQGQMLNPEWVKLQETTKPEDHSEQDALKFWAVIAPCGEGVLFLNEADARWTQTGEGVGSDGFGVPTLGESFRECYEDEQLELVHVRIAAQAAQQGGDKQ